MGTKVELLVNLLDELREALRSIQKERFNLNADEVPLETKKKITDENFQKVIKLKNEDYNAILSIRNEIIALDKNDNDLRAYENDGIEDKIATVNNCFDQTFAVVDQMKRETEFLENTSTEYEYESTEADKTNEFSKNKDGSNSCGDSNSISDVMVQDTRSNNDYIKEVFGKSLTKALASVILHQPNDPIDYLAKFLHKYRENEQLETDSSTKRCLF